MGNTPPKRVLCLGVGVPAMPCAPRPRDDEAVAGFLSASSKLPVQRVLSALCGRQTAFPNSEFCIQEEDVPAGVKSSHAVRVVAPAFAPKGCSGDLSTGWDIKGLQLQLMKAESVDAYVFVVESNEEAVEGSAALLRRVFAPRAECGWGALLDTARILIIVLPALTPLTEQRAPAESAITDIRGRLGLADHPRVVVCSVRGPEGNKEGGEAIKEVRCREAAAIRIAWHEFFKK